MARIVKRRVNRFGEPITRLGGCDIGPRGPLERSRRKTAPGAKFGRDEALALWREYKQGTAQAEIGRRLGVSRQRIHQLFARFRFARLG